MASSQRSKIKVFGQDVFQFLSFPFTYSLTKLKDQASLQPSFPLPVKSKLHKGHKAENNEEKLPPAKPLRKNLPKTLNVTPEKCVNISLPVETLSSSIADSEINPQLRVPECVFLFCGLDVAGITSTVDTAFYLPNDKIGVSNAELQIVETKYTFPPPIPLTLKIIDVPGFCKGQCVEQDAELSIALKSYLKCHLPLQVPTIIFIVVRFDDKRFQGEASEFSKMLKALSHSLQYGTDQKCSNIMLILTHSHKVKEDEISEKMAAFRQTFHSVFEKVENNSVKCIHLDNIEDRKNGHYKILEALTKRVKKTKGKPSSLKALECFIQNYKLQEIDKSKWETLLVSHSAKQVKSLLPPTRRVVNELLDLLLQGISFAELSPTIDIDDLDYFVLSSSNNPEELGNNYQDSTWLPHDSDIIMADGSSIKINQLFVGDKLMDKDFNPVIVTSISIKPFSHDMTQYYVALKDPIRYLEYVGPSKIRKVVGDGLKKTYDKPKERMLYCSLEINNGLKKCSIIADKLVMYSNNFGSE